MFSRSEKSDYMKCLTCKGDLFGVLRAWCLLSVFSGVVGVVLVLSVRAG